MQANECFMCSSNNFTVIDGAFVCNECGIQSQSIREEKIAFCDNIRNTVHDDIVDKDHEITSGSQLEKARKLLSWECFNLILLGLTDEIIELGAKPSIKVIVLQLWVRYLQCIEAAFISKKFKKIPKLNTTINDVDCQILYGVENIKTKILYAKTGIKKESKKIKRQSNKRKSVMSNKSSASSFISTSQKRSKMTRNLRKMDNSTRDLDDSMVLSDDVSLLQRSIKSSKIKVKLLKNIKKSLKSMPSKTGNIVDEESAIIFKSGLKCWNKLKLKEKKNVLSIKTIISIIRLALMINNDDIYLSDILRWIHEGHFHVNRIDLFLPENTVHGIHFTLIVHIASRNGLNLDLNMLLNHLEASQLPNIDFKKLVTRFCDELQLPDDFTHFVCKLLLICPPNIKISSILPDVEVIVMTYILFAAKFLFCLDGNAENLSSNFAEKINESNRVDKKLFNWNNYVEYIECRNSIISQYNYLLHKNVYGNNVRNTQTFINDWNIRTSTKTLNDKVLSKDFKEKTEHLFQSLPDIRKKNSYRQIPASTKPLSSTLKWVSEYYSMQLSGEAKAILKNNFTQTDVSYLTDKKRIYDLAEICGVPIEVNCNKPLHYMKQQTKNKKVTKNAKLYIKQTKIMISDDDKPINKKEHNDILNDSYEDEKPNTIFLGTGLNYWFIHMDDLLLNKTEDITKINSILKQKLPHSFLWFMNLCCRILNCTLSVIYVELKRLEKKFSRFLKTYKKKKKPSV